MHVHLLLEEEGRELRQQNTTRKGTAIPYTLDGAGTVQTLVKISILHEKLTILEKTCPFLF